MTSVVILLHIGINKYNCYIEKTNEILGIGDYFLVSFRRKYKKKIKHF